MSPNEPTNQFFPSYLKWASIAFFGFIALGIVAVALFSPQLIHDRVKSAMDNSSPQTSESDSTLQKIPPATSSAGLVESKPSPPASSQQTITVTEEIPANTESNNPGNYPDASVGQIGSQYEHCQYSGNQTPTILGIRYRQNKYYYTPGSQPYYVLQNKAKIDKWFCREAIAIQQGWTKGPDNILSLIQQNEATKNNNAGPKGLINGVLNMLGM